MNNTLFFFKLSSALTIVAIERDLCQSNQASLDHVSCHLRVISSLYAHMKSSLVTECVNATSMYSRMKVTPSFGITHRLLVSCGYSTLSLFFTGMIMIHVFICVDGAFFLSPSSSEDVMGTLSGFF